MGAYSQMRIDIYSEQSIAELASGDEVEAIVGFDMRSTRRNALEVCIYAGANEVDYHPLAKELTRSLEGRHGLWIMPSKVSRMELSALKS